MNSRKVHTIYDVGYMGYQAARAARDRSRERARMMARAALFVLAMTAMGAAIAVGFGGCGGEGAAEIDPPLYPACPRMVLEAIQIDNSVCSSPAIPYTASGRQTVKTGLCRVPSGEPPIGCVVMDNYANPLWLCVAACEVSR
jgi:hypothetical protein